jgi:hypothetical protein
VVICAELSRHAAQSDPPVLGAQTRHPVLPTRSLEPLMAIRAEQSRLAVQSDPPDAQTACYVDRAAARADSKPSRVDFRRYPAHAVALIER